MVKYGILSDTHITNKSSSSEINYLIELLKKAFKNVDKILHAGDICELFFLEELKKIAPVKAVRGNLDNIDNLEPFLKISKGNYNLGIIHKEPQDLDQFLKKYELNILITGHSHQPVIKQIKGNILILNPGSPTQPKAPLQKKGFNKPIARPTIITLNIDEENLLSTFLINLNSRS